MKFPCKKWGKLNVNYFKTKKGFITKKKCDFFAVTRKITIKSLCEAQDNWNFSYCIGKIEDFDYTTRLSYLGLCIFAKRNAHVCVESFAFANAHFSYFFAFLHKYKPFWIWINITGVLGLLLKRRNLLCVKKLILMLLRKTNMTM